MSSEIKKINKILTVENSNCVVAKLSSCLFFQEMKKISSFGDVESLRDIVLKLLVRKHF